MYKHAILKIVLELWNIFCFSNAKLALNLSMLRFISIILIAISSLSYAQIQVVDKQLAGISNVQLIIDNNVIAISDISGRISFDTSLLDKGVCILNHKGFYPTEITKNKLAENKVILLTDKMQAIPGIVVTPSRLPQLKNDVALQLDIIDSKKINLYQPQTAVDLLNLENKVYIQKSQQGGGSPMIRGFATNRILLVVDDVRMNTAIFRSGNVQNVVSIDPFSIETTQVLFGPASQFYGSDAIGGVLSFKTKSVTLGKKDSLATNGNVNLRYSSASSETTQHLDYNVGGEKFGSLTSVSFSKFGDLKMGKNGPDEYTRPFYVVRFEDKDSIISNNNINEQVYSGYNQFNFLQKFLYKPNEQTSISYNFQASYTSDIPRYDRLLLANNRNPVNGDWYYGPQQWMFNQVALEHNSKLMFADRIKLNIANQQFTESRNDRKYNSNTLRKREEHVSANSINLDLQKRLSKRYSLSYGGEYIHNLVNSSAEIFDLITFDKTPTSTRYPDGSTWASTGIYANILSKWNFWFNTEAGFRYNNTLAKGSFDTTYYPFPEQDFSNSNQAISGSIAQIFKFKKGSIGFITSSAFRAPNIDDLSKVFDSNPGLVVLPNANLKPEYAYNAEINLDYTAYKKLKISISVFYTYLDNAISKASSTFNGMDSIFYDGVYSGVETLVNQDFASIYGSQLSIEYLLNKHLTFKSNYTLLKSASSNNEPIKHITPNFGGSSLIYTKNNLNVSIYSVYNQAFTSNQFTIGELNDAYLYAKDESGNPYAPAWGTLNLKSQYSFKRPVTLSFGIENILNTRYRPYSSGITAPGRNFIIGFQAKI